MEVPRLADWSVGGMQFVLFRLVREGDSMCVVSWASKRHTIHWKIQQWLDGFKDILEQSGALLFCVEMNQLCH